MSNDRWPQGVPLGQPFKDVPFAHRQNPPVLPPPATLEAGQQFPFPLPVLGSRAGASPGHVFTIPLISSDRRPLQQVHVPGYATLGPAPGPMPFDKDDELPAGVLARLALLLAYRPLNVKDALSYLDQVKIQFYNQADVYNNFLDIMKDFKLQSIDTPGVIDRVLTLFHGHPNLIQGFNTFLPPGYKIECLLDPLDPNPVRVTTPTGSTTRPNVPFEKRDGGQVEFNHAISYVNKIKTRFAHQPDVYKQFLEILQTYQREQKPISEVYEQVTLLFANLPDLLHDFKQFLPDSSQPHENGWLGALFQGPLPPLPPLGSFQPEEYLAVRAQKAAPAPALVSSVPEPVPPLEQVLSSSLTEELAFFDRVKRAVGNKQLYTEFLKLLNLYSQEIIDKATLVERVHSFLGDTNPDLVHWFRQFVGYTEPTQHIEQIQFRKHQLELLLCKAYGPLYRQLPRVETYMPCLGRDDMCWEVLNDEWVGHPTWALEDLGFISHRKNQYEEILFKIEEERLEFDYHMEANLRTIQTLETIANRIANMLPEQQAAFKLPPGLGQLLQTIYKKVIRKVYDKESHKVVEALHDNPSVAVPVVLRRLKQKDEEWRRAQREWNKVWREMEQKVFYKLLDHLGLTFKQADKKLLTAKQLVSEISTVKVEQQNKRVYPLTPKPQEQLDYVFDDFGVLYDVVHLACYYVRLLNYLLGDKERLVAFLRHFVAVFFGVEPAAVDAALAERAQLSNKRPREDEADREPKRQRRLSLPEPAKPGELWIQTEQPPEPPEMPRDRFHMFCNTTIYVFFRHLRTLYERLHEVKQMNSTVAAELAARRVPAFAHDLHLVSHQLEELAVEIDGTRDCYKQVLLLAERLLDGDVEHQWFEELLRQGYSNRAYKCYTLDKVVQLMVKHMHTVLTDQKTLEIVTLFEHDRSLGAALAREQILYRMQVRLLMASDENMFKLTYEPAASRVNIQFVALDDLTINNHANAEERYNYYLTSFVMSHPTEGVPASKVTMPFHKAFIEASDDECDGQASLGLKVSVCQNSYRLFFEAGSHDEYTANTVFVHRDEPKQDKLAALDAVLGDWRSSLDEDEAKEAEERFNTLLERGPESKPDADTTIQQEADTTHADTTIQQADTTKDDTMEDAEAATEES